MADFHQQNQQLSPPQNHQQNNYYQLHHQQQQFTQQQQRSQSQSVVQQQQQQITVAGGVNGGMTPMQHNYLTAQHHQQMQHQIRSATPPNQGLQQRQQGGFSHPGMLQQIRQQMHHQQQQQQGSPQQMFHQGVVQPRPTVRPVGVASPHQQQNMGGGGGQPQQQHYFVRQPGMHNLVQVTSSTSPSGQSQFVHQQSQLRQMLPPSGVPFRQNVVIQREHKSQIIRFPAQQSSLVSADKLSPQQELHVLQQHFPSAQMHQQQQQTSSYHQQVQAQQQQHFIAHQQQQQHQVAIVQHSQHQQMPSMSQSGGLAMTMGGGGPPPQPMSIFVTASGHQFVQSHPKPQIHHNFASQPHPAMMAVAQQQNNNRGASTTIVNGGGGGMGPMVEYTGGPTAGFTQPTSAGQESGRVSIKIETSPTAAVIMEQQLDSPNSPSTDSQAAAPSTTTTASKNTTKKPSGKASVKAGSSVNQQKGGGGVNKAQAVSRPSPPDSDLIKASGPGQTIQKLLDREALDTFVKGVDANEVLEDEVSEALQLVLGDFVDDIIRNSAELSKHRGSSKIEARDVRFVLANNFQMAIPSESLLGGTILSNNSAGGQPPAKRPALMAHQQRMAMIDKALKKM